MVKIKNNLLEALGNFEIIDCHEHLPPEKNRLESRVDIFTLFSHYTHYDLLNAGMNEADYQSLYDRSISLGCRWKKFEPYWKQIRRGSYARAVLLAVQRFYGFNDINDKTYQPLSEAIQEANKPGIYERVLRDACKIRTALTQCGSTDLGTPLLTPVMPMVYEMETSDALLHPVFAPGTTIQTLDEYLKAVGEYVLRVKSEGAVGLKMVSGPYGEPSRSEAVSFFEKIKSGKEKIPICQFPDFPRPNPLRDYIIDWTIRFASEQDLVITVHTGYWGDFRQLDPLHMIPILKRHPKARFDLYHIGYPWVRETLMLGKGFPNVWLNFCWTYIISQHFAMEALDEAIDLIPMNKILGFGGDYSIPVEKVYGHLFMAREVIAEILANRIQNKQFSESEAITLARKWLWDNPKELYRLRI